MSEQANPGMGETLVQIRIEMARLGEKIDQLKDLHNEVKAVDTVAKEAFQRSKVSENRIKDIEDGQRWLWRTVATSAIVTFASLIVAFIKILGTQGS